MVKLELTLDPNYVEWTVPEAVREFLQNAKDEDTLGHPMRVTHNAKTLVLRIENSGTILTRDTLVLGRTNKRGDGTMIGHFGEGYKLATIALLRRGLTVKILTGGDRWTPSIERSDKFANAELLVWDIEGGRPSGLDKVVVEIGGIDADAWDVVQDATLWLRPPTDTIKTSHGTLLRGDRYRGKLFVKGLLVGALPGSYHDGFDLDDVALDRDRKLANPWDLSAALSNLWDEAMAKVPALARTFMQRLREGDQDVGRAAYHCFSADAQGAIKAAFSEVHGAAVPVGSLGEAQALENLGVKAAVVSRQEMEVLRSILPKHEDVLRDRSRGVAAIYQLGDLSEVEHATLRRAVELIQRGDAGFNLDHVKVVDFHSEGTCGTFDPAGSDISVARRLLADPPELVATLVHERCHQGGSHDGTVAHEHAIERLLSRALWNS